MNKKEISNSTSSASPVKCAQFLYLYDSRNTIPNGDPYTGIQRIDDATGRIEISDVRMKRYVRDSLLDTNQHDIFVRKVDRDELKECQDADADDTASASAARLDILAKKYGKIGAQELLLKCIDVRGFGGLSTKKGSTAQVTGPIQMSMFNPSLNRVRLKPNQNTSVFQSSMLKKQGAMGLSMVVPYSMNQIIGWINPLTAAKTGLIEADVLLILEHLWKGVNIHGNGTRSKNGQGSRLLLKINKALNDQMLLDLDYQIILKNSEDTNLRMIDELKWDFSRLVKTLSSEMVTTVEYRVEQALEQEFLNQMAPIASKLVKI